MFSLRIPAGVLIAALLLVLPAAAAPAQAPSAWTAAERHAALATLRNGGELLDSPDASVSDAVLESALLRFAGAELGQRLQPSSVEPFWALEPARIDVPESLAAARQAGRLAAWLAGLSPPFAGYRDLLSLRCRYRLIADAGGWAALPPGAAPKAGERSPDAAALRTRLAIEGYKPATRDATLFDAGLQRALGEFQASHGLPDTGRLDGPTRAALDVPVETRLMTIEANLERWRWLPHDLPSTRLELDVAGAEVRLLADSAPVLEMKAIVGDPRHRTPMFVSRLTAVVFDPPWNVPKAIADQEILPKAARDPGYLARNDFTFIDGRLVQRPGPKNSLGSVKFDLPSPFGVYLHDTPARTLFARRVRTLSHGCMRLEKPQALAAWLLRPQGWSSAEVTAAMGAGRTQTVALQRSLPLFVLYWTAAVDAEGHGIFRSDPYGWDGALNAALSRAAAVRSARAERVPATECAAPRG